MARIIIALVISAVATAVLFVGAAMADGMSHSMRSMYTLFPYGTFVVMHFNDDVGLPLALLQFPAYAIVLTITKGKRWKLCVLLLLIALHVAAASFALHDYCSSRRRCSLRGDPSIRWTAKAGSDSRLLNP